MYKGPTDEQYDLFHAPRLTDDSWHQPQEPPRPSRNTTFQLGHPLQVRSLAHRIRAALGPILGLILFSAAIVLLVRDLSDVTWQDFVEGLTGVPPLYLGFAAVLIALNYFLLITYDMLALRYIKRPLPLRRVALVGFLGYALGNNLGTLVAATPLRFRLYSMWGIAPKQIMAIVVLLGLTFWSGICWLAGTVLLCVPVPVPEEIELPFSTQVFGGVLLSVGIAYAVICIAWRKPLPIGGLRLCPPHIELMTLQTSVAALDLTISAIALYLVLPPNSSIAFALVMAAYLVGITISLVSQVPGGLGVLELILLNLLAANVGNAVVGSLLMFRLLYYVLPLIVALGVLATFEISRSREAKRLRARIDYAHDLKTEPHRPGTEAEFRVQERHETETLAKQAEESASSASQQSSAASNSKDDASTTQ